MTLYALLLLACGPSTDDVVADDTGGADLGLTLAVATVATDYTAGQLAVLNAGGTVTDALFPTTTDPTVEAHDGYVFLLDRSAENTVRMYAAGDWSAPLVEFSTGDGSNPQDVAICGDVLVVSTLAGGTLDLHDMGTGLARGTIDLSPWDDGDGSPEADTILEGPDGALYVTLNRYDTTSTPWSSADGTGTIVRVDCDTLAVTAEWTVGPNPGLVPHPVDATKMLLRTGDYFNADYTAKLDGAVYTFDPIAGTVSNPHLTEAELGFNIGAIAGNAAGNAILVADDAYAWNVFCLDLETWTTTATPPVNAYINDAVATPDGKVWVGYRAGYAATEDPVVAGLVAWDPATCTAADPVATIFPPYSMALVR